MKSKTAMIPLSTGAVIICAVLGLGNDSSAADPGFFGPAPFLTGFYTASPTLVDIDGDSDLDMVVSGYFTDIQFRQNTGNPNVFLLAPPVSLIPGMTNTKSNCFGDLDGDGDLDMLVEKANTTIGTMYFENTGHATSPAFAAGVPQTFGLGYGPPTLVDIDGDGDLDAFVGKPFYEATFHRNTGNKHNPLFAPAVNASTLGITGLGFECSLDFGDLDGDGDLDCLAGHLGGVLQFFRNTGSRTLPAFAAPVSGPFGLGDVGGRCAPSIGDMNSDGDPDVFCGSYTTIHFFHNTLPFTVAFDPVPSAYTDENQLVFTFEFSKRMPTSFTIDSINVMGTITPVQKMLASDPSNPRYSVVLNLPDDSAEGTAFVEIPGSVRNIGGAFLGSAVQSGIITVNNDSPPGDVSKDGTFDIADVALLADANLGLATLP